MRLNGKIILFFVIFVPLAFYIYFEVKKSRTGIRLKKLPVMSQGALPGFTLLAHNSDTLTRAAVEGKIIVSDFFFTKCRGICPVMSRSMRRLQEYIEKNPNFHSQIMLLSHTVDPYHDSVGVLKDYAEAYGANDSLWLLVTGDKPQLYDLAINFYKLPALESPEDSLHPYAHSERFVLLDKEGFIRGYYDGTDSASVKQLMKDMVDLDLAYKIQNK